MSLSKEIWKYEVFNKIKTKWDEKRGRFFMVKLPRFETSCLQTGVKTLVSETGQQLPPSLVELLYPRNKSPSILSKFLGYSVVQIILSLSHFLPLKSVIFNWKVLFYSIWHCN